MGVIEIQDGEKCRKCRSSTWGCPDTSLCGSCYDKEGEGLE